MIDKPTPRVSDTPRPGYYLLRLVRNGPRIAAEIMRHEDGSYSVMVDGETQGPSMNPWSLPNMERVHFYGRESTVAEVQFRIGMTRWAKLYAPTHPAANPRKAIDPGDSPIIF